MVDFLRAGKKKMESKGFDEMDVVGHKDVSNDKSAWTKGKLIDGGSFNKDASERETVIGLIIKEGDVVALFTGLVEGLQKRIAEYEESEKKLKLKVDKYERFLKRIERETNTFLKLWGNGTENPKLVGRLKKIVSDIKTVLET